MLTHAPSLQGRYARQKLNQHEDSLLRDFDDLTFLVGLVVIIAVLMLAIIWIFFPGISEEVERTIKKKGGGYRQYEPVADTGMELRSFPANSDSSS